MQVIWELFLAPPVSLDSNAPGDPVSERFFFFDEGKAKAKAEGMEPAHPQLQWYELYSDGYPSGIDVRMSLTFPNHNWYLRKVKVE